MHSFRYVLLAVAVIRSNKNDRAVFDFVFAFDGVKIVYLNGFNFCLNVFYTLVVCIYKAVFSSVFRAWFAMGMAVYGILQVFMDMR